MKKSKKRKEQPLDRLSELPDSIIFEIFGVLPMRDFVRTTILSKRWNNLWTTTPYLNFDSYHSFEFINRALILWKGFKILKFNVASIRLPNSAVFSDIDGWVNLAKKNGVEELYLDNIYDGTRKFYCVPHNLYSCSSLKVLSLKGCNIQIHGNVQLNQLNSLTIERCDIDEHSISQVVSGSPQLEVFILNLWESDENVSIQSSSLKKLLIERRFCHLSPEQELRIWSPNLETLDFVGVPFGKHSLMNVSSLTHITLDFSYDFPNGCFVGEILEEIFPTIQHVEKLTISDWCIEGLGAIEDKHLLAPLLNFKFLTIKKYEVTYEEIFDILQIFPKLKTLVLRSHNYNRDLELEYSRFPQLERNLPESFLQQLNTVEITWSKGDDFIFPFIEILLKHASKLQKMALGVSGIKPLSMPLFLALQKLLKFPRSSPTAELIFADC